MVKESDRLHRLFTPSSISIFINGHTSKHTIVQLIRRLQGTGSNTCAKGLAGYLSVSAVPSYVSLSIG